MDSDISLIIFIGLLIVGSAYFSATETAFSSLNRIRLKNMAQSGNKRAQLVLDLCEKYDKLLTSILIGNNIVNILSSSIATTLFVTYFPKQGVALSTIVMTVVVLIFGEITPKSIAKEVPCYVLSTYYKCYFVGVDTCMLFLYTYKKRNC